MKGPLCTANLLISTLMMVIIILSNANMMTEGQSNGRCKTQRRVLVNACKPLLARRPPSAYCCQRLRRTPSGCICSVITPQLAALIDLNYALKVLRRCGRHIPRHFKCGSITTP